jgi:hypothetical protein
MISESNVALKLYFSYITKCRTIDYIIFHLFSFDKVVHSNK